MRHFRQEFLPGLGHARLLLGRAPRHLGLDPQGHILLVQEDAGAARHRIWDRTGLHVVPSGAVAGMHRAQRRDGRRARRRQHGHAFGGDREPRDEAAFSIAIGAECGRVGKQASAVPVEQADQRRGVTQGLGGPPFLGRDLFDRGFEQEQGLAGAIDHGRHRGLGRHGPAVGEEGPPLAHGLAVGRRLHEAPDARLHGRGSRREVAGGQRLETVGAPEGQGGGVGVGFLPGLRIIEPDRPSEPVPARVETS